MSVYVLNLKDIDQTKSTLTGGKAANLGELFKINGISVPEGICITTAAYKELVKNNGRLQTLLDQLALLKADDRKSITEAGAKIRHLIEAFILPQNIIEEIARYLFVFGEQDAFVIRSSATAEDLPNASFAGQQDTYLNMIGEQEILRHITKCWSSLFTDRAITYRIQNKMDPHQIGMAVIVQKMVFAQAAGILFTADPATSNRKIVSIEAGFGLGESLVSGLVNADMYKVFDNRVTDKKISTKTLAIYPATEGGTKKLQLKPEMQNAQVLTDTQIVQLAHIGKQIEAHFGCPQDIEWCLADQDFYIVQSRPITTLFPVPSERWADLSPVNETNEEGNRVYVSVGHQQMMTDAMKPLGLSFWLLTTAAMMRVAAGRLFVDVTAMLASSAGRDTLINVLGKSDPLIKDALTNVIERDFIKAFPEDKKETKPGVSQSHATKRDFQTLKDYDPAIVSDLIRSREKSIEKLKQNIRTKSGAELFDFIREDILQLKSTMSDPQSFGVMMTGMNASSWVNEKMQEWLGEKNAADTLAHSAPHNITSQMGLDLLELSDAILPFPEVIKYLQQAKNDEFLNGISKLPGGPETLSALYAYLDKYGMRGAGEIDITKPRWAERPATLVPLILNNISNFPTGAAHRKFEQGLREALEKEKDLMERLKKLPEGEQKATETKRMIGLIRSFSGYREYPKYHMVSRYFIYKQALLREAMQLVEGGILQGKEDVYYLTFEELRETVRTKQTDYRIINKRKDEFKQYEKLTPPRVITSEGEIITGNYKRGNLPAGAMAGLAVSSGIVEGRARIILHMEDAKLEQRDILVTRFTDPSWTLLFVTIAGLVTEVGGLMTHGAVIAREYGLPAVVGVQHATMRIKDGQRIRINGTDGYIEILPESEI